jgi:hypothetical protein
MNIDLRPSTRRMIEQSPASTEAWSFIEWLHAQRYTDYTIDCHIRRLMFVMPRLEPGSSPPVLTDIETYDVSGPDGLRARDALVWIKQLRRVLPRPLTPGKKVGRVHTIL